MNWLDVGIAAGRWALWSSAGAGVIAVLVLGVQRILGERISPRWRHNLWLLVVARLMFPAIPVLHLPARIGLSGMRRRALWTIRGPLRQR